MKTFTGFSVAACFAAVFLMGPSAWAQEESPIPLLRAGPSFGRIGGSISYTSAYLEVNPFRRCGFYGLIGRSGASGDDHDPDLGKVPWSEGDLVAAGGADCRFLEIRKLHVKPGVFLQTAYLGSHVNAVASTPGGGWMPVYQQNLKDPLVTPGIQFEIAPPHGPPFLVRVGRNFSTEKDSIANSGYGISFSVTPLFDPVHAGRAGWRGARRLF